jgi:hypothetical protein
MIPNINYEAVGNHNRIAPAITTATEVIDTHGGKDSVDVTVHLYIDYYGNLNARLYILDPTVRHWNLVCSQWNGDHQWKRYHNHRAEPGYWDLNKEDIPKGIAQYKFRNIVGGIALKLRDDYRSQP